MWWGFVAALGGMLLYAAASLLQAFAAHRASGAAVLRHPAYLAGMTCDGLAWLSSLVALGVLPLFVVQSLLAGSLAVTVLLAIPLLRLRPTRRDLLAVAVVTAGLVLVSASAAAESAAPPPSWFGPALLAGIAVVVLASAVSHARGGAMLLAVLSGLGFSGGALGARVARIGEVPWRQTVADPVTWALVVSGVAGAVLYARALEKGSVGPATAAMWVVEVVVPGALGVLVLGDGVRDGWAVPALAGVAIAVAGCVVLAQSSAQG